MTTDAIYKERGSDWSHQVSAVRQLNGCSVTRPFLSAKGVACKTTAWDGDVNVWLRVSYNTLATIASLCVGEKEGYTLTE